MNNRKRQGSEENGINHSHSQDSTPSKIPSNDKTVVYNILEHRLDMALKIFRADNFHDVNKWLERFNITINPGELYGASSDLFRRCEVAKCILDSIREAATSVLTEIVINQTLLDQISEIVLIAAKWCLEYNPIHFPEHSGIHGRLFGTEIPPWDLLPESLPTARFLSLHPSIKSKIVAMEDLIKSVSEIVDKLKIQNIITWSWLKYPPSLSEQWTNFDQGNEKIKKRIAGGHYETKIRLDKTRYITHAMSVKSFLTLLKNTQLSSGEFRITGVKSEIQYTHPALVWCGVALTDEECTQIPSGVQYHLNGHEANRYGTVVLKFPCSTVLDKYEENGHILGTRQYLKEFSQTILVTSKNVSPSSDSDCNRELFFVV